MTPDEARHDEVTRAPGLRIERSGAKERAFGFDRERGGGVATTGVLAPKRPPRTTGCMCAPGDPLCSCLP
jgi:hypothetical protein